MKTCIRYIDNQNVYYIQNLHKNHKCNHKSNHEFTCLLSMIARVQLIWFPKVGSSINVDSFDAKIRSVFGVDTD